MIDKGETKGLISQAKQRQRPLVGVGVCVFKQQQNIPYILMLQRPNGLWTIPGGKQEWGETIHQCGIREIQEETGLCIVPKSDFYRLSDFLHRDDNNRVQQHYTLVTLVAPYKGGKIIPEQSHDIKTVCWLPLNHVLSEDFTPPLWERTKDVIRHAYAHLYG